MGKKSTIWNYGNFILCYRLKVQGGSEVPYLGYVEAHLKVPEVCAFGTDVLLLIVPDSADTAHTPITLGTLYIDMAINLATTTELEILKKNNGIGV